MYELELTEGEDDDEEDEGDGTRDAGASDGLGARSWQASVEPSGVSIVGGSFLGGVLGSGVSRGGAGGLAAGS